MGQIISNLLSEGHLRDILQVTFLIKKHYGHLGQSIQEWTK